MEVLNAWKFSQIKKTFINILIKLKLAFMKSLLCFKGLIDSEVEKMNQMSMVYSEEKLTLGLILLLIFLTVVQLWWGTLRWNFTTIEIGITFNCDIGLQEFLLQLKKKSMFLRKLIWFASKAILRLFNFDVKQHKKQFYRIFIE